MSLKKLCQCVVLGGLTALAAGSSARAATIALTSDADTYLRDDTVRGGFVFMDVRGGNIDFRGYLRFNLASIPPGATITSATLNLNQISGASRNDNITTARFALYGLNNEAGNTPQNWDENTFVLSSKGAEDVTTLTGVTDLDGDVPGITETVAGDSPNGVVTVSGSPLLSFLQTRLADGGLATFILSNDDDTDRGFGIATKENTAMVPVPTLTIDYVPEPTAAALAAVGALAAALRRRK